MSWRIEDLEQLGLIGTLAGPTEVVRAPGGGQHMLAPRPHSAALWDPNEEAPFPSIETLHFLAGRVDAAARQGAEVSVDWSRPVVMLRAPAGPLQVATAGGAQVQQDPFDSAVAYVDLTAGGSVHVRGPGTGLLIGASGDTLLFAATEIALGAGALSFEPLPVPDPPAPRPPWQDDALEALAHIGSRAAHLAAQGLCVRFDGAWDVGTARATVAAALAGQPGPGDAARAWFAALPTDVRRDALAEALLEADAILEALEDLAEDLELTDPDWRETLRDTLHRRDDLESICCLLRGTDELTALESALQPLDAFGEDLVASLPDAALPQEDPRLAAVQSVDPGRWWATSGRAQ